MRKNFALMLLCVLVAFVACDGSDDSGPADPPIIKTDFLSVVSVGADTVTTTKLILTFDKDIEGLTADDLLLTAGTTGAVKGLLLAKGSGVYELTVSGIITGGDVSIIVSKTGYEITPESRDATVCYVDPVKQVLFNALSANGSATETTTLLTLTFDNDINGLTADDLSFTAGTSGAVKGLLVAKGSGVYELAVSGIIAGGEVNVAVNKEGHEITPETRTVVVYCIPPVEQVSLVSLTADGSVTETTNKLFLTLDKYIPLTSFNDIILDAGNTGAVLESWSFMSSCVLEIKLRGINASGEVTVTVKKEKYEFIPASKTVTVHYMNIIGDFYYSDNTHSAQRNPDKDCIGIVFWQDPDNSSKGKIVSLDHSYAGPVELSRWANAKKGSWGLATKDDLQQLWCVYNGGAPVTWDEDTYDPLAVNTDAQTAFNNKLIAGGGVAIDNSKHWTSTKYGSGYNNFIVDFWNGVIFIGSNTSYRGRAVSPFEVR